jgi:hypothetical protein
MSRTLLPERRLCRKLWNRESKYKSAKSRYYLNLQEILNKHHPLTCQRENGEVLVAIVQIFCINRWLIKTWVSINVILAIIWYNSQLVKGIPAARYIYQFYTQSTATNKGKGLTIWSDWSLDNSTNKPLKVMVIFTMKIQLRHSLQSTEEKMLLNICHAYLQIFFFFTEVRGTCRKQFCLFWLPRAMDFKVSCSQIPRRAFTGIRTHDPLVESPMS